MDVYIYQEKVRKVKGEETTFLDPIGVLEGFESTDEALEALLDADPSYMGVELVIWESEPQYITPEEPTTKYQFNRRNGNSVVEEVEEDVEPEDEEPEEVEEEEEAPAKPTRARRGASKPKAAAKRPPSKPAGKRPASRAGTRASGGSARRSPFTRNAASAE